MGVDLLVAHQRAQDTFAHVLVNVTSDQLSSRTPCPEWDVKALIDHVIAGNQRVVERAGGQVAPLPDDLGAAHSASAKAAQETFAAPEALNRTYQEVDGGGVAKDVRAHAATGLGAVEIGTMTTDELVDAESGHGSPVGGEHGCLGLAGSAY